DPISVRARSNSEAWVVNHISDDISIVSLTTGNVVRTLRTGDEPSDVVFAGTDGRAFVSCAMDDQVMVFDPAAPDALPAVIDIDGESPRALAVSPDGSTVYAAIFFSGNASTVLNGGHGLAGLSRVVNNPATPYGGVNPPPNGPNGTFVPPQHPNNPPPPRVGLIVRKNADQWLDDNGTDWTPWVSGANASMSNRPTGWDLPDRDVAIIDAASRTVTGYAHGAMNIVMGLAVNPADGRITVIGTDGTNQVRYEPNLNGIFLRVLVGLFDPAVDPPALTSRDLNPHLAYLQSNIPAGERDKSLGDPRAIVWNSAGDLAWIAGMGSNNLVRIDASGSRVPDPSSGAADVVTTDVGEGPTGLALNEGLGVLYCLNRFEGTISLVNVTTAAERGVVSFFDPTPAVIRLGRKHLFDTHKNSGLGHVACGSCHVNTRMDKLAWDLGNPAEEMEIGAILDQNLGAGQPGFDPFTVPPGLQFQDWHPMKGPMTTQTLQDIIGHEPHHWRGDRFGIEEFEGAFVSLQGKDVPPTPAEMQQFENYLDTITFPPNPYRNFDNSLPTALDLDGHYATGRFTLAKGDPLPAGNAINGLHLYTDVNTDGVKCQQCHALPHGSGTNFVWDGSQYNPFPTGPMGEKHRHLITADGQSNRTMKIAQLRNMQDKTGMSFAITENNAGFGYLHDGTIPAIENFIDIFALADDQELADLVALMLTFAGSDLGEDNSLRTDVEKPPGGSSQDTHAAVGWQTTVVDGTALPVVQDALIDSMLAEADDLDVGVIVKGRVQGVARGFVYLPVSPGFPFAGAFQSDRAGEIWTIDEVKGKAAPGNELTWTVTPRSAAHRMGVDRDQDTFLDLDEIENCSDPADPLSTPCPGDSTGDRRVNFDDLNDVLGHWNSVGPVGDVNCDDRVNFEDLNRVLENWGLECTW
ncbi:MAG: hypothetical protein KDA21_02500, partial [Phycisphaerales bacterium]|nr:hypothetical protein [Phycisphaerales bacterium]